MPKETFTNPMGSHDQLRAIRANDEKALQLFYRNNYPKVEKYVLDNNGTRDEAKDVYQEAFIAVWRNLQLDRFEPQHAGSLDGYLYRIAKNKWLDHLRLVKHQKVIPLSEGISETEETTAVKEEELQQLESIKTNIRLLGDMCQKVLERFYYYKDSMRTIADTMKWTEATAKNNKYRCLQQLRELVKNNKTNLE